MSNMSFGNMCNSCGGPSLFPCFSQPCTMCDPWNCDPCRKPCAPCPPPCPDTCSLVCARRLPPCERPCQCGRCDECRGRNRGCLPDLRGIQINVADVDCCGNLILQVRRPRQCCVNGQLVNCRRFV